MSLYQIHREQLLATDLDAAWRFFSDPVNLARITPKWLAFEVFAAPRGPIYPGMIIRYRVRPVAGLPVRWTTEITHVRERELFVDEQRFGPYRFWHHLHRFEETDDGVRMLDLVHYRLYGGPAAAPLHRWLVRPRLEAIFNHRRQVLGARFALAPAEG